MSDLGNLKSLDLTKKKELDELDPCIFPKLTGLKHLYLGPGKLRDLEADREPHLASSRCARRSTRSRI